MPDTEPDKPRSFREGLFDEALALAIPSAEATLRRRKTATNILEAANADHVAQALVLIAAELHSLARVQALKLLIESR